MLVILIVLQEILKEQIYLHYFFYDDEFTYYDFQDYINNTYTYFSLNKDIGFIDFYKDNTYQIKLFTINYSSHESLKFNDTEELFNFFNNLKQKFLDNSIFK